MSRSIVVVVLVFDTLFSTEPCGLFLGGPSPPFVPSRLREWVERDLGGKSLLRLFVHPLDAFRVWIRVGSFFVKIDFDGFRASVWPCSLFVLLTCSFLTSKFGQKKIMIFLAKFDRFLIPKKVTEPNGCRFSLTFESRLRRRGVRRAQWLHVFPQK